MHYKWWLALGAVGVAVSCTTERPNPSATLDSPATSAALPLAPCDASGSKQSSELSNGGFEEPSMAEPGYLTVAANAPPDKFGWVVHADGVDVCRAGWASGGTTVSADAYEGEQYLDLVGYGSSGKISQTVAVSAGVEHTLRFAYANNPLSTRNAAARVKVYDCGAVLLSKTFNHDASTAEDLNWTVFEATIKSKQQAVTLEIESTYAEGSGGILLDGITVGRDQAPSVGVEGEQPSTAAARVTP